MFNLVVRERVKVIVASVVSILETIENTPRAFILLAVRFTGAG